MDKNLRKKKLLLQQLNLLQPKYQTPPYTLSGFYYRGTISPLLHVAS